MSSFSTSEPHQATLAASLLGNEHPLVLAVEDHRQAVERLLAVLGLLLAAAVAVLAGLGWAVWVVGSAAAVAVVAAASLWARRTARDAEVLALIMRGGGGTPIPLVRRACERLLSDDRRAALARALELVSGQPVRDGEQAIHPASPFLSRPAAASAVASELAAIAEQIRTRDVGVAGLALAERLVTDGTSALYGDDAQLLGDELARVRFLLRS